MASGARYRVTGSKKLIGKATAYSGSLTNLGARAAVTAAEAGAEEMKRVISTSGTGWDGRLGPSEGRIDSGAMLRDVTYDKQARAGVARKSGRISRYARFGWIKNLEDYYYYQDAGFVNVGKFNASADGGPPGYTLPMNAFSQGYYIAREVFRSEIRRLTKKSWGK